MKNNWEGIIALGLFVVMGVLCWAGYQCVQESLLPGDQLDYDAVGWAGVCAVFAGSVGGVGIMYLVNWRMTLKQARANQESPQKG